MSLESNRVARKYNQLLHEFYWAVEEHADLQSYDPNISVAAGKRGEISATVMQPNSTAASLGTVTRITYHLMADYVYKTIETTSQDKRLRESDAIAGQLFERSQRLAGFIACGMSHLEAEAAYDAKYLVASTIANTYSTDATNDIDYVTAEELSGLIRRINDSYEL